MYRPKKRPPKQQRWVLNKYTDQIPDNAINIMRPSIFGNPFDLKTYSRDEALELYTDYLEKRIKNNKLFRHEVKQLINSPLVCCCWPRPCHGQILRAACVELNRGKNENGK